MSSIRRPEGLVSRGNQHLLVKDHSNWMFEMRNYSGGSLEEILNPRLCLGATLIAVAVIILFANNVIYAESGNQERLVAGLNGDQVIPRVKTNATGELFFLPENGTLSFMLNITGISNLTKIEIQTANTSQNGPTVTNLLVPAGAKTQTSNQIILKGNVTSSDLVGAMDGKPLTFLRDSMLKGATYVIVSTQQYPNGEIRGQIGSEGRDESDTSLGQNNVTNTVDQLDEPE